MIEGSEDKVNNETSNALFHQQPICSALQVFSSMGGLALLAQHLPTIYPEAVRLTTAEKSAPDQSDSEWIKVEGKKFFCISYFISYSLI